jgi:hypothetical protein
VRTAVDTVIIHALRHGMDPGSDVRLVAVELVAAAGGRPSVLRAALARTDRALADRASGVGRRARDALQQSVAVAPRPTPRAGLVSLSG